MSSDYMSRVPYQVRAMAPALGITVVALVIAVILRDIYFPDDR